MSDEKEYHGGCHCSRVRFKVTTSLASTITCNCSICQKTGTILAFAPEANFELTSGESDLTDYQFYKHALHHVFCKTCGIRSFIRGTAPDGRIMVAVNVRCLDEVDLTALTPKAVDGRSL